MKKLIFIAASFFIFAGNMPDAPGKTKIKTMIVTGQDGSHWWQGGSEAIKMILENSELFTVDILVTPSWGEDMTAYNPDFFSYDLVVIHYGGTTWAE
ncbi:MAG: ThuA domain-containing protein, partial [Prevotellaceae bacterium]|nr:ThuA domain-containing protein [Prevotellaceae bacterium]